MLRRLTTRGRPPIPTPPTIRMNFLDLDCVTLRQGSPHTLLCTKNDRSYEYEQDQRGNDGILLRKLEVCGAGAARKRSS